MLNYFFLFLSITNFDIWSNAEGNDIQDTTGNITIFRNLSYADSGRNRRLDLYIPCSTDGILPFIIWIPGGSFISSFKDIPAKIESIENLSRHGFAVADVKYTLFDEQIWPAQIYDIKGAIRWLRSNAGIFSLNPDKIGILGLSAGANLSMLAGTSGDEKSVEGTVGGNENFSSKVQVTVNISGVSDYTTIYQDCITQGLPHCQIMIDKNLQLFGCDSISKCYKLEMEASAVNYISPDDPPALILNGEDELIPKAQATVFYNYLQNEQVESALIIAPGSLHAREIYELYSNDIIKYFNNYLK
jgi:acetyl esterase/lipase